MDDKYCETSNLIENVYCQLWNDDKNEALYL